MAAKMTTLSDRLYRRGMRAIERRRAENEQHRAELAERLARVEWLEQQNERLVAENRRMREAIAKFAGSIDNVLRMRSGRAPEPSMVDGGGPETAGAQFKFQ